LQNPDHLFPEIRHRAGPADLPLTSFRRVIHIHHWTLLRDALHRAQRDSGQSGHLRLRMASLQQNLDLMSLKHA
jgi:hypothetical protein